MLLKVISVVIFSENSWGIHYTKRGAIHLSLQPHNPPKIAPLTNEINSIQKWSKPTYLEGHFDAIVWGSETV